MSKSAPKNMSGFVLAAGLLSGLFWMSVASFPAAGAAAAHTPNFAPDDSTGWVPARGLERRWSG